MNIDSLYKPIKEKACLQQNINYVRHERVKLEKEFKLKIELIMADSRG